MGFGDKQKAKADERIRTLVETSLEPGEAIREQFQAMTPFRFWPVFLGAFPIAFYLEYTGRGDLVPWLMGLSIGAYFMIKVRTYLLVLTDRRLVILLLRRMSTKRVGQTDTYTRGEVSEASFSDGLLNGRLSLKTRDAPLELQIGSPFKDRARRLVDELGAPKA